MLVNETLNTTALQQLGRARTLVAERSTLITDATLSAACTEHTKIVSLCVVDDDWMLAGEWLQPPGSESKRRHSFVMCLEDFIGLLLHSASGGDIVATLTNMASRIPEPPDSPLLRLRFPQD